MSTKMISTRVSISRDNHDNIHIHIRLVDQASRKLLGSARLTCEEFGMLVTGVSMTDIPCEIDVDQGSIGKKRVDAPREVLCPINSYNTNELSDWLIENCQEEGWHINSYLGSKGSIDRAIGSVDATILRYTVYKFE